MTAGHRVSIVKFTLVPGSRGFLNMNLKKHRTLSLMAVIGASCLALAWFGKQENNGPISLLAMYGGVKSAAPRLDGPLPSIRVTSPVGIRPLKKGEPFDCIVNLTLPRSGELPSLVNVRISKNNVYSADVIPSLERVGVDTYRCSATLQAPNRPGRYSLEVECTDLVGRPDSKRFRLSFVSVQLEFH